MELFKLLDLYIDFAMVRDEFLMKAVEYVDNTEENKNFSLKAKEMDIEMNAKYEDYISKLDQMNNDEIADVIEIINGKIAELNERMEESEDKVKISRRISMYENAINVLNNRISKSSSK